MDKAQRTHQPDVDRPSSKEHEGKRVQPQKVASRERPIDPAEEVMNGNPNLSPPIIPNPN